MKQNTFCGIDDDVLGSEEYISVYDGKRGGILTFNSKSQEVIYGIINNNFQNACLN